MPIPLKRRFLPLIFLLSFIAIFLYYHSSLRLSSPTYPSPLTPRHNTDPNFSFTVKVLAFDRLDSLRRCLRSLANADYGGDRVGLHVYIDHFRGIDPVNGSDLVERKLGEAHGMLKFVDGFVWGHGEKHVHYRTDNVGLQAQWLEAWWPGSDDEFVFVVEDDLEVSDLYYRYLKGLILKYYYDPSNYSPSIYGASLQRPRFVPGKHGNKLQLDAETHIFLYQLVGTWGQLLFPKPWKEFRLWYDAHKSKGIKPFLEGMVTTGWYKRMGEKIWTPWFIKFIHSHGYYNIYTNFQHERALSISHRDVGVNYGKSAGPDSTLLDESSVDFSIWEMQPLKNLKWYDFCFREVLPQRIVRRSDELGYLLNSMLKQKNVIFVSLYGTAERVIRNLLCHFERLNIRNYIFVGSDSEFLFDLARRGHPVISAEELNNDIKAHKLVSFRFADTVIVREVLIKAYVMKKCLKHGFNAWMVGSNLLPLSDSLFQEANDASYDFFATRDTELLYVRGSSISERIWTDDFLRKLTDATSSASAGSDSENPLLFTNLVANAFEDPSGMRIVRDVALSFGIKLVGSTHAMDVVNGKKLVFWSYGKGLDFIEEELRNIGMWIIDGDSSCTAVLCHKS